MSRNKTLFKLTGGAAILLAGTFIFTVAIRANQFAKTTAAVELTSAQKNELQQILHNQYAEHYELTKALPYDLGALELDVRAESAILIDVSNGCVLYEKNADEIIPPASMTKLFAMYVVDEEVSAGNLSYNQIIPLPPQVWACNMPPHSSLMFLGEGQKVTLEELLLGLSICSGNDAAYALAYTICGTMEAFVERMNQVAADLGLENTHFVESSGYSELNTTTATEMARFCRIYLQQHPDSLKRYHSVQQFSYPKQKNLGDGDVLVASQDFTQGFPSKILVTITQKNTNPLLGKLEGCDGLKTGYIDESGYNLALTAARNGNRYLSVTMKGPGMNVAEGQANRIHDGTELMEFAFNNFFDYELSDDKKSFPVKIYGAKECSLNLVCGYEDVVTIPFISGDSFEQCKKDIALVCNLPEKLYGEVVAGQELGTLEIHVKENMIAVIPLVADRTIKKANVLFRIADKFIQ